MIIIAALIICVLIFFTMVINEMDKEERKKHSRIRRRIFSLDTMLPWGKHEGHTIKWIIDNDLDYIDDGLRFENYSLDKEAMAYYENK